MTDRTPTTSVSFACNDPDNGSFAGRVADVHLDDLDIELHGYEIAFSDLKSDPPPALGKIRVGRRVFRYRTMTTWLGNWCWDGCQMEEPEARRLVAYLLERGWRAELHPTEGPWADLFNESGEAAPVAAQKDGA